MAEVKLKVFSPKESIKYGWATFKKNWFFLIAITLISFVANYLPSIYVELIKDRQNAITYSLLMNIVSVVISLGFALGQIYIMLKLVDGQRPTYKDLFSKFNLNILYRTFVSNLLVVISVFGGLILLIIPGIIISIRLSFTQYAILDKNAGPIESLKMSWAMTEGKVHDLFAYSVLAFGVALLGILALLVGYFAVIPILALAYTYIYRKLSPKTAKAQNETKTESETSDASATSEESSSI